MTDDELEERLRRLAQAPRGAEPDWEAMAADVRAAGRALEELGGGVVVVAQGEVRASLPLPYAGLMSDLPPQEAAARLVPAQAEWANRVGAAQDTEQWLSALTTLRELRRHLEQEVPQAGGASE